MPSIVQDDGAAGDDTSTRDVLKELSPSNRPGSEVAEISVMGPGDVDTSLETESKEHEGPGSEGAQEAEGLPNPSPVNEEIDTPALSGSGKSGADRAASPSFRDEPNEDEVAPGCVGGLSKSSASDGDLAGDHQEEESGGKVQMIEGFRIHPLAGLMPEMTGAEYSELKKSIASENGLLETITIFDGQILDGRHRARACLELKIPPRYEEWTGLGSPAAFVVAKNLHRRHLSTTRRAIIAADFSSMRKGRPPKNAQDQAYSQPEAAKLMNVSRTVVQQASKVRNRGTPSLLEAVKSDEIPLAVAAQIAGLPEAEQRGSIEEAKRRKSAPRDRRKTVGSPVAEPVADAKEASRAASNPSIGLADGSEGGGGGGGVAAAKPTAVARFADACSVIEEIHLDVLREIDEGLGGEASASLASESCRALTALWKVKARIDKAVNGD